MSYWVYLEIKQGQSLADVFERNMTSNVAPMWRKAGANLAELDGKLGEWMIPPLTVAVVRMKAEPDEYKKLNSPNGWGDYETTLAFLEDLLAACREHPQATFRANH